MKILSVFDGISCARVAVQSLGIKIESYYSSEIDPYALRVQRANHLNNIETGDIKNIKRNKIGEIDLLIGGSPCQDLSIIQRTMRMGLNGEKSKLFWEYVRVLDKIKPHYFIFENVHSMPKEDRCVISNALGVEPILIDASLVSAQKRKRLFWTNIMDITQPQDKNILLMNIVQGECFGVWSDYSNKTAYEKFWTISGSVGAARSVAGQRIITSNVKINRLTPRGGFKGRYSIEEREVPYADILKVTRQITPIECERLQSLPDNYTSAVSNSRRYKLTGNAFNVNVVAHIISHIPNYAA